MNLSLTLLWLVLFKCTKKIENFSKDECIHCTILNDHFLKNDYY